MYVSNTITRAYVRNTRMSLHIILFTTLLVQMDSVSLGENCNNLSLPRSRRELLFPNTTLLQLNIGVGTPSPVKQVNVNWAIQANFNLPWNRTQAPMDILYANSGYGGDSREQRDAGHEGYVNDAKLYHFYKHIEDVLSVFGHNGSSCVLRTLCQLGAEPLSAVDDEDLLHELASFVLNPLNDVSEDPAPESLTYIQAYKEGVEGRDCLSIYYDCTLPLIEMFSQLH